MRSVQTGWSSMPHEGAATVVSEASSVVFAAVSAAAPLRARAATVSILKKTIAADLLFCFYKERNLHPMHAVSKLSSGEPICGSWVGFQYLRISMCLLR